MFICHLAFTVVLLLLSIDLSRQEIAPVFTPDNESLIKNHKQIEQLDKSAGDLQAAEIVLPVVTVNSPINQTNVAKSTPNNANKLRKRKYQSNKQYRPNERKGQFDSLAYNLDTLKKNQLNELNNALLIQLANRKLGNNQELPDKYSPLLASLASSTSNNETPFQLVPIYTTESPSVNGVLVNNDPNQLAVQLYLRKLAQLAQLQKQSRSPEIEKQEKPRLQKRVSNQALSTSPSNNLQQLASLNQLLQASSNQQQPVYTFLQPQQSTQPLYLALQPSFPVMSSSSNRDNGQAQNPQVSSLIETGDKIFAKIKQWSTDVFNPKSSLNRQISEVLGVVSDVALVTLIGVPVLSLLSLGVSSLMQPLSQLNRKVDRTKSASKQKIKSEEKKDNKDEKTAKSDTSTHASQKNTKMLDKKSKLVSLMERAGDEFAHFKNLVEIAKNFELAFKKYNVQERECKYRVLCEISSSSKTNESTDHFLSSNLLREGRTSRQVRSISSRMLPAVELQQLTTTTTSTPASNQSKAGDCTTNCSTKATATKEPAKPAERNQRGGGFRNLIRGLIDENRESFISFVSTIDQLMNKAQRSNFFSYLTDDQINQAFRSDSKLFKTIAERSKQLQDKLKDFLDNLTVFQQVVSKESASLDNNKMKYKMFNYYNLARSKRTTNAKSNTNETSLPSNSLENDNASEYENVDVSGLKFVLSDLVHQLKFEQNQDNLILPLSRLWLNPYLTAYEYGQRHTQNQCKSRFLKCQTNFIGLNNGGDFDKRTVDLETVISNNHLIKQPLLKKKPNQSDKP